MDKKSFYEIGKDLTDKVYHHRYDRYYPIFLEKFRDKEFNLLEIGVDGGGSVNLWKEYFPHAHIHGIDIKENNNISNIAKIYKYDQSKESDLNEAVLNIPKCSIIVDDGSHIPEHQLNTFIKFFDGLLDNGGIYIIEDVECNYWKIDSKIYGYKLSGFSIFEYFQNLIHQVNSEFSNQNNFNHISSITFAHNCIIIVKQTLEEIEFSKRIYRGKNNLKLTDANDDV